MTTAAFVKSLRALEGFPSGMIEYLMDRATDFSADQRKDLIKTLKPVSDAATKLLNQTVDMYEKAEKKIAKLVKTELPKKRKAQEKAERASELKNIDSNLFS